MKAFVKPTVVDNWGYITYVLGSDKLMPGDKVEVQWPDGSVTDEVLVGKMAENYVSEQGVARPHRVVYTELFVVTKTRGSEVEVPVEKLKLHRWSK
jgi:hypothetical protein